MEWISGIAAQNKFVSGTGLITVDTLLPSVLSFQVGNGAAQRSMVKSLTLGFSEPVSVASAISLLLHAGGAVPNVTVTLGNPLLDQMTYVLSFTGTAVIGESLPDGIYDLVTSALLTSDIAGNLMAADDTRTFHRLFGDSDGNKVVNSLDYSLLRATYNRRSTDPAFDSRLDFDGNGVVNALDLANFRSRYGVRYVYSTPLRPAGVSSAAR